MNVNNVFVNYIKYGEGSDTIVLLHGWGQNIAMMKGIGDRLQKYFQIVIIDLPGYGESDEPKYAWTINDYVDCIHTLLAKLDVQNPILIGHSFGGKISLLYASIYKVKKLVCLASPFRKDKESKYLKFKLKILKVAKRIPLLNKLEGFAKNILAQQTINKQVK